MSKIFYFFKEAFQNFRRNWSTSLGAIITIFLSLFVIGLFMVATIMVNNVFGSYADEISISVFIADDADQADIDQLTSDIQSMDHVESTTWISKDQALEDFSNSSSTNSSIIEQLDGTNPLPASIRVQLSDADQVETVANNILANSTFVKICDNPDNPVDSLSYGQKSVKRLLQIVNFVRYASIAIVILLIFVTFIFINNTIRLAILARRREISIMRLVGASNGFIRGPFMMEAFLQAVIGWLLSVGLLQLIRQTAIPKLQASISFLNLEISSTSFVQIYLIIALIGLIIALFGSLLAMRRYLKV